jgi:hypothetical protein
MFAVPYFLRDYWSRGLSMRSLSLYSKHLECVVEKIRALDFTKETNTFVILHKVKDGNVIT